MRGPNETDVSGLPIDPNEPKDAMIDVWQITPCFDTAYDCTLIRSYQEMLRLLEQNVCVWVDAQQEEDLRDGIRLEIKIVKMRLDSYEEIVDAWRENR